MLLRLTSDSVLDSSLRLPKWVSQAQADKRMEQTEAKGAERRAAEEAETRNGILVFALNGERFEVPSVDPSTTLLEFLRSKTRFKSPKLSCGEGITICFSFFIYLYLNLHCDRLYFCVYIRWLIQKIV